ncbi:IclR family transcriptional regulator [Streptomyces armeniacus]|uniref:IclR family transcriptional regulator n=1 Tax=Streptomyces armeniacus TaxID=83291 RepID=A0A345XIA0_9ACTN|nr:IclR family transcriptional regulator C-terminal domain-containing protein [Streptomyces armeniacus]AXK31366.1 IclR family transcriptional regulator [Streptomyces armeniacus]
MSPPPSTAAAAGAFAPDADADAAGAAEHAEPGVLGPLERGVAVLRALSAPDGHRQRPSDLVHTTGLARATVDRLVSTLTRIGYVRPAGRDIEPAPRLMELGNGYLASSGIPDALGPFTAELADAVDESVSLAVPDGTGVRFVAQCTRRRAMSLAFRIGDLVPAERCAAGTVLAAGWDEAGYDAWRERRRADPDDAGFPIAPRRDAPSAAEVEADFRHRTEGAAASGWAVDDGLVEPGLIAVAAPVHDAEGRPVCAVSVVSHTSRHTLDSLAGAAVPRLREMLPAMGRALAEAEAPGAAAPAPLDDVTREAKGELGADFLQSLARGLAVLRALGTRRGGCTLSEAAKATGLPRATARRALLSLVHLGYVEYAEAAGRRFRMLPRVLELGYAHLSGLGFTDLAEPHLRRLAAEAGESASMAVLDGPDIRYVARVPTYRIMTVNITVGTRFPAYATSMGRVLLAGLPAAERTELLARTELRRFTSRTVTGPAELERILADTEEAGYALVDGELEEGLRSLAVPVRDAAGHVVAAVNVPTHAGRHSADETRAALLPALRAAQAGMEADLRAVGGVPGVPGAGG